MKVLAPPVVAQARGYPWYGPLETAIPTALSATRFEGDVTAREGFAIVTMSWVATATFGSLPYLLSGVLDSPVAAGRPSAVTNS